MIRKEAIRLISKEIGDRVIVSANGYIAEIYLRWMTSPQIFI